MTRAATIQDDYALSNPIDLIEETIVDEDWPYQRLSNEEIIMEIPGRWGDYRLQFVWQEDISVLQLYCTIAMRVEPKAQTSVFELLSIINERLALGHFEISSDENFPTYRYGILLLNSKMLGIEFLEELIDIAVGECERFYPAFQFVLWGGKSAKEAAEVAMLDTVGEA